MSEKFTTVTRQEALEEESNWRELREEASVHLKNLLSEYPDLERLREVILYQIDQIDIRNNKEDRFLAEELAKKLTEINSIKP